jgi:hypothetical protein
MCWYCIEKAKILQAALYKPYFVHDLMKAVADFFNATTGAELKLVLISAFNVIQMVWISCAY